MAVASIEIPSVAARTSTRRVVPRAMEPNVEQWAQFDVASRRALTGLLRTPVEFVDHPLFHDRVGRRALFAKDAPRVTVPRRGSSLSSGCETLLFLRYNYARYRQARILRKHRCRHMPTDQLRKLLAWSGRALAARSAIIEPNMPLVLAMIRRNRFLSLDFNELISEGNLALLRCVDKYDCSRGNRFSTYACRSILKSFARVAIKASRYRSRFPFEFDSALEKGGGSEPCCSDSEALCLEEIRKILRDNRAALNDVEMRVIRARFLADAASSGQCPQTLEQIGGAIGVTKERVRQIQLRALRKLRLTLQDSLMR